MFEDAKERLEIAERSIGEIEERLQKEMWELIGKFAHKWDPEKNNWELTLPPGREAGGKVSRRLKAMVGGAFEDLRSALDYAMAELTESRRDDQKAFRGGFVLVNTPRQFEKKLERELKDLTRIEREIIEQVQPYKGNEVLRMVRDASNRSKHIKLLRIQGGGEIVIKVEEVDGQEVPSGWKVMEQANGSRMVARGGPGSLVLDERYDAVETIRRGVKIVRGVIRALEQAQTDDKVIALSFD